MGGKGSGGFGGRHKKEHGRVSFIVSCTEEERQKVKDMAEGKGLTVTDLVLNSLKIRGLGMTAEMKEAIANVMYMVNTWELTKAESKNLKLAQEGNEGALCDLLASQGLQNNSAFDAFYASIKQSGE